MHRLKNGTEMCNIIHKRLTGPSGGGGVGACKFRGFATYPPERLRDTPIQTLVLLSLCLSKPWGDVLKKGFAWEAPFDVLKVSMVTKATFVITMAVFFLKKTLDF